MFKLKIVIEGTEYNWTERSYKGDYHTLHAADWNERMRSMLDSINESEPHDDNS